MFLYTIIYTDGGYFHGASRVVYDHTRRALKNGYRPEIRRIVRGYVYLSSQSHGGVAVVE